MKKRDHKKALRKRVNRIKAKNAYILPDEPTKEQRNAMLDEYSENSGFTVMPSMIEALELQDITNDDKFIAARNKNTEWLTIGVKDVITRTKALDYLPNMAITFIIPLDFHLPLPEYYVSGTLSGPEKITEANCVTVFSKILPVGNVGIKTSYMLVTMCDNETIRLARTNKTSSYQKIFEKAISLANNVISGLQSVPNVHNHNMHNLTPLAVNTIIKWFFTDRTAKKCSKIQTLTNKDRIFTDILTSLPIENEALDHYKANHVWNSFTGDKVFELVSLFSSAVNSRCFGRNDRAILDADTFAEYSLGYIYCETRVSQGDDLDEVVEYFNKITKSGLRPIWREYASLLGYDDTESGAEKLKNDVNFDNYDTYCRKKRNDLHHHFVADNYGELDSLLAVYYAGEMIRKLCELAIAGHLDDANLLVAKLTLLKNSTLFFKNMAEHLSETNRDRLGNKIINLN